MTIPALASELNRRSTVHSVGSLQALRASLKSHKRALPPDIFTPQTTHDDYAFHHGGRTELQFNIGLDTLEKASIVRYGVAFSFELSQTLPTIDALLPKVARFNEFLRIYPEAYDDCRMWHFTLDVRSSNYPPSPIPAERCTPRTFVFLGSWAPDSSPDPDAILDLFDRMLPLYSFVEASVSQFPHQVLSLASPKPFVPGNTTKKPATSYTTSAGVIDVSLRHNHLQSILYDVLAAKHGVASVGTEQLLADGTQADVIVSTGTDRIIYELKTCLSARACVREAMSQLLEYGFWPGNEPATALVVVGEAPLDPATAAYLAEMSSRLGIPLNYNRLDSGASLLDAAPSTGAFLRS